MLTQPSGFKRSICLKTDCMKPTFILLLALSIGAASCQKELSRVKTEAPVENIFAAMEAQQPAPQRFTISAAATSTVSGPRGTRVTVPANAFVTPSGAAVTGNVTLELKEIYDVWEMVVNNKFTQVGLTPIESGGQFFIRATQNGQELKLAPGARLQAALPAAATLPGMEVFTGSSFDTAGRSIFSWQLAANPATDNVTFGVDSAGLQHYLMQFTMLGWINCDRFLNEPLHKAQVTIANAQPNEQVGVLVHFDGMKSVMQLWNEGGTFTGSIPARPVTFIAVSNRGGQTYAAFQSVQAQPGQTHALTLAPISEAAFGERLKSLN